MTRGPAKTRIPGRTLSVRNHILLDEIPLCKLALAGGVAIAPPGGMYASPKRSGLISALIHGAVFALLLLTGRVVKTLPTLVDHGSVVLPSDLIKYQVTRTEHSGGGGQNEPDAATARASSEDHTPSLRPPDGPHRKHPAGDRDGDGHPG